MTRSEMAQTLASVARMAVDLVGEAEAETAAERKVSNDLVEQITDEIAEVEHLKSEVADYERTVATLREQLRAEEARRASYQAVDAAARRLVSRMEREGRTLQDLGERFTLYREDLGHLLRAIEGSA